MFVPAASAVNGINNNVYNNNITTTTNIPSNNLHNNVLHHNEGPDSLNATYISVVSASC